MAEKERKSVSDLMVTKNNSAQIVAEYLSANEAELHLAEKVEASQKSINKCWEYITHKARALCKGAGCIAVKDEDVFNWAVHFYEENGEPEDMPKPVVQTQRTPVVMPVKPETPNVPPKPNSKQLSMFDLMGEA